MTLAPMPTKPPPRPAARGHEYDDLLELALDGELDLFQIDVNLYHKMIEAGFENSNVELLDGLLILKRRGPAGGDPMSVGEKHATAVELLGELKPLLKPLGCHLRTQNPSSLRANSEPEPDGCIARGGIRDYAGGHPTVHDLSCVIEVSDSSLAADRTSKLQRYARAGIPQYVIENLVDDQVEVHENPDRANGTYGTRTLLRAGDTLELLLPGGGRLAVDIGDLLP